MQFAFTARFQFAEALLIAVAVFLAASYVVPPSAGAEPLTIGTFNVHYLAPGQTDLAWERRAEAVAQAVAAMEADIVGFQEMETFAGGHYNRENVQQTFLEERFPEFRFSATGNPQVFPNTQPIAYRADRLVPLDQGFFFFSETPEVIYSDPWAGRWPSFATWTLLEDTTTGERLYVYNVHFDFSSIRNRRKSADLVRRRIESRDHPEVPVVLLGDFNALEWFPAVREFRSLGLFPVSPGGATYHFYRGVHLLPAIDHILVPDVFEVSDRRIVRANQSGSWASDHYPVVVTLICRYSKK